MFAFLGSLAVALWAMYPDWDHMEIVLVCIPPPYLFFILVMYRIFEVPVQEDEYKADYRAAQNLKKGLGIRKPSETLRKALESIQDGDSKYPLLHQVFDLLYGGMHPSNDERVQHIRDTVDDP